MSILLINKEKDLHKVSRGIKITWINSWDQFFPLFW